MDYLTKCSAILNILRSVEYTDVPNCKLVNRRIYDIIRRNPLYMPRKKRLLRLWIPIEKDSQSKLIHLYMEDEVVFVTEKQTVLVKYRRPIKDYYGQNGIKYGPADSGTLSEEVLEHINHYHYSIDKCLVYKNTSIPDGIRLFLSFFLNRYHLSGLKITNEGHSISSIILPHLWQNIFIEEFRRNRCQCEVFYARNFRTGVPELADALGCSKIIIEVVVLNQNLIDFFPVFKLKRRLLLNVELFRSRSNYTLPHAAKIIQMWANGLFTLDQVTMSIRLEVSNKRLDTVMAALKGATVWTEKSNSKTSKRMAFVKRSSDSKVLRITMVSRGELLFNEL